MTGVYSVFIWMYDRLLLPMAALFHSKAHSLHSGRRDQLSRITPRISEWKNNRVYWIHAASYGEFEMARPLVNRLLDRSVQNRLVVSFYSPSGYERLNIDSERIIKIYLPPDSYSQQNKYLELIRPTAVFYIKYEYWFNMLKALRQQSIPYYFISITLDSEHYLLKPFFRPLLQLVAGAHRLLAHSATTAELLAQAGIRDNVALFGDLRIPQVLENRSQKTISLEWKRHHPTIIYGSVTGFELRHVIRCIQEMQEFNHIVALHDVEPELLKKINQAFGESHPLSAGTKIPGRLLVVDSYGQLKKLYSSADIAFIGGGFEKGPHNILEALVYGLPVITGPQIRKFPMAVEAYENSIITICRKPAALPSAIRTVIEYDNPDRKRERKEFVENHNPDMSLLEEIINALES